MDPTLFFVLIASLFLGWCAGANDAASAVGTSLGARTLSYRKAVLIVVVFSMLGFLLQGQQVVDTVGGGILPKEVFAGNGKVVLAALIAASVITFATVLLALPISINHTLIGGIVGMAWILGMAGSLDYGTLSRVMACWLATPFISFAVTLLFHKLVVTPIARRMDWIIFSQIFKLLAVASAMIVSYSLGASAIGTILSPLLSSEIDGVLPSSGPIPPRLLLGLLVAVAFGLGVVIFSGRVIRTLSSKIALLGPATAFSAQFSAAVTVYGFVLIGLPASITHAVVGSIAAVGALKGTETLGTKTVGSIILGWTLAPLLSAALAVGVYSLL
ncbi:MAG: inorganic phosphate transporter [Candidatus Altiarchaeota archaeon]|nr:inorganic phosphate transporter [Candidatus Altiarchaeota archaeon]